MKEPTSVYGTHVLKSTAVKKRVCHFWSGRELMGDDARAGWLATAGNVCNVEKLKWEMKKDHWKVIRDVIDSTNISRMSVHKILRQNLKKKKVCLKLVLRVLTLEQKKERVFIAETFLNNCKVDQMLLGQIITGDESWVFKYDPPTKSMQWKRRMFQQKQWIKTEENITVNCWANCKNWLFIGVFQCFLAFRLYFISWKKKPRQYNRIHQF